MIGLVVAAAFAAAAATVAVARAIAGRSERKSVEGYERVLDTLGGVTRRSDAKAPVRVPDNAELAKPHVAAARPTALTDAVPRELPRPRLDTPILTGAALSGRDEPLVFVDDALRTPSTADQPARRAWWGGRRSRPVEGSDVVLGVVDSSDHEDAEVPSIPFDDVLEGPTVLEGRPVRPFAPTHVRSATSGRSARSGVKVAALVVVLAGAGAGAWAATRHTAGSVVGDASAGAASTHPQAAPTTTTLPSTFQPASVSSTLVAFDVPSGTLQISFSSSKACWLGVFSGSSSAPSYQWMHTLAAGETTTYAATGPVSIRVPLALPSQNVAPYDLELIAT
jgi:hypothetical protein